MHKESHSFAFFIPVFYFSNKAMMVDLYEIRHKSKITHSLRMVWPSFVSIYPSNRRREAWHIDDDNKIMNRHKFEITHSLEMVWPSFVPITQVITEEKLCTLMTTI